MHIHLQSPPPRVGRARDLSPAATSTLDRRSLCIAALVLPVIAGAATIASTDTPFRIAEAQWMAARARFNGLPSDLERTNPAAFRREADAMSDAWEIVNKAPVATWPEFAASLSIATDAGLDLPRVDVLAKLVADAKRLAGEA